MADRRRRRAVGAVAIATVAVCALAVVGGGWFRGSGSGSEPPRFAETSALTPFSVSGAVFVDDGDGVPGAGDRAIADAEVRLGSDGQWFSADSALTRSGSDGSFILETPPSRLGDPELFVEVRLSVDDPNGDDTGSTVSRRVRVGEKRQAIAVAWPDVPHRCGDECGSPLLPDLLAMVDGIESPGGDLPLPVDSLSVDRSTEPGRTLLRFATIAANVGDGPLHVVSTHDGDEHVAWQRVWHAEQGYIDAEVSSFDVDDDHHHVHVPDFEEYRLLDGSGREVAETRKVSFCLVDIFRVPTVAELEWGVFGQAGNCGDIEQAINVGFSDYYGPFFDNQWIDITDVEPGVYELQIIVDPDDRFREIDESNNSVSMTVELLASGEAVVVSGSSGGDR